MLFYFLMSQMKPPFFIVLQIKFKVAVEEAIENGSAFSCTNIHLILTTNFMYLFCNLCHTFKVFT